MRDRRRVTMRAGAVGLGLAGLALTVPTFAAAPERPATAPEKLEKPAAAGKGAKEKCCLVELDGPAQTVTAGGAPVRFDLVVSRSERGCTQTQRRITVRLDGLATEHVRLERVVSEQVFELRDTSTEAGTVEAVDPLLDSKLICGEDTAVAASYRIAFLDGTPPGQADLVVSALAVNGRLLDSAKATTVVVDAVRTTAPPPQTTPPAPPATEGPVEETTAPPAPEESAAPEAPEAPPAVARPPLERRAQVNPVSTTLLTSSVVLALSAILLLGVLWRLRRTRPAVPADEAPTATLPPGVGAELARLTDDSGAAGPTRPAAP